MPEELPAILKAATDPIERLNAAQQATIADLGHQLDASQKQVLGFFRVIGEAEIEVEAIPGRLGEIAGHYKALVAQAGTEAGDDPETVRLKAELRETYRRIAGTPSSTIVADFLMAVGPRRRRRSAGARSICSAPTVTSRLPGSTARACYGH
jgi:hypothetical protein